VPYRPPLNIKIIIIEKMMHRPSFNSGTEGLSPRLDMQARPFYGSGVLVGPNAWFIFLFSKFNMFLTP